MTAAEFTRWFLALFFVGVAGFYTVRIIQVGYRLHASPVFSGDPGTRHWAHHAAFRFFRVLILLVCLARLAWPPLDHFLVPFDGLWHPVMLLCGDTMLAGGFAAAIAIHFYMGDNWRSGTRDGAGTHLITSGPFAYSRNPMMLSVMTAQAGLFLAMPSVFTLICLAVGWWAVVAQTAVEERSLQRRFGADYEHYRAATPRWIRWHSSFR